MRQPVATDEVEKYRGMNFDTGSQPLPPAGVRSSEQITQLARTQDAWLSTNEDDLSFEITVRLFQGHVITQRGDRSIGAIITNPSLRHSFDNRISDRCSS